ncbi:MAG: beta-N-acetylglucosaminidase [Flavobacterium sp.]|nr:MAG: beta-N-acetylglucosaminidase [Flavobacterium sp.]
MRYFLFFIVGLSQLVSAQSNRLYERPKENVWVDSVYNQMSFDEHVGQLFMVSAFSNKDSLHVKSIDNLIKCNHIGGLLFLQGGPGRQATLTNRYQQESKIPLFIGIDAEWGLAMRLDSINRFPWNMTLGAIQNIDLIKKVGVEYGKQAARIGVQFNFAPVLDINTNPKNPIIGNRSFGEDKVNVTERALALMKGIQSTGVLATGKHFPGHGDTSVDSHYSLPVVNFSKERIEAVEFYPYRRLFNEGLASVMVAHLNVPSLEKENLPSSISYNVVTNILQKELGFNGLIFTDALNMKGAANFKQPGEIDLAAFLAGNDVLLFPENVPVAFEKFCVAYQDSIITEERLAHSVKKILKYKYRTGLDHYQPIKMQNLTADLNTAANDAFQYELYENAITVIKNQDEILPIKKLEDEKIAYVKLGDDKHSPFLSTLQKYTEVTEIDEENLDSLQVRLKPFTKVIVGFHKADGAWKNHSWKPEELAKLDSIAKYNNVILDVFAKPYSLLQVTNFVNIKGIVVSYQNTDVSQVVSGELIFGAVESKGKLPVTINGMFPVNFGLQTKKVNRLGFTAPENVGMDSKILNRIDDYARKAIAGKMTPGMQILVARKGKVIYQKSFGNHSYDNTQKVTNSDLYDVASITKMVSTLPNVMQAYDQGKVNLESQLGEMLPVFANSDKKSIHFKELLSHYARLQAWIPFYKNTLDSLKKPSPEYYRQAYDPKFSKQVAENLFIRNDYHDTIIKAIADSKLNPKKEYKYSDFTFIILKEYLEKSTGKTLDSLSYNNFYRSLGMNNTLYNPLMRYDASAIPPTENDTYFRYQTIQGYVHDMEAAMEGGVGGHAGIFSNAMDIAKMMQMYLQKGNYGDHQYFSAKTFDDFNTCWYCKEGNRRGLGFDKPQLPGQPGPTCGCVSASSFGHTGFTGGIAWADPETEIVYVFLSNRTYPDSNAPNTLSKENIREDIQKVIQDAIIK